MGTAKSQSDIRMLSGDIYSGNTHHDVGFKMPWLLCEKMHSKYFSTGIIVNQTYSLFYSARRKKMRPKTLPEKSDVIAKI